MSGNVCSYYKYNSPTPIQLTFPNTGTPRDNDEVKRHSKTVKYVNNKYTVSRLKSSSEQDFNLEIKTESSKQKARDTSMPLYLLTSSVSE